MYRVILTVILYFGCVCNLAFAEKFSEAEIEAWARAEQNKMEKSEIPLLSLNIKCSNGSYYELTNKEIMNYTVNTYTSKLNVQVTMDLYFSISGYTYGVDNSPSRMWFEGPMIEENLFDLKGRWGFDGVCSGRANVINFRKIIK